MPNCTSRQPVSSPFYRITLICLLFCAFALRLYHLDAQSLWYDEGVTANIAQRSLLELTRWTANDIQPPFYYYVVAGWGRLAGWGEWSLRFPSAVFGTLLIPLLAGLAMRLLRRWPAALLTALFATFHPLLVYYSQEARMYSLLVTLGVLAGYLLLRAGETDDRLLWMAYTLTAALAVYTHYFAAFLLFALVLAYGLERLFVGIQLAAGPQQTQPGPQHISRFLVANFALFLLYVPWLTPLFNRLQVDTSYWQGRLKLWEALRSIAMRFTTGETMLEVNARWWLIPYALVTLITLITLLRLVWGKGQRAARLAHALLYACTWLCVPIVAILLLASFTPKFNARYVIIALPGLLLLWGAGCALLLERVLQSSIFNLQSFYPSSFTKLLEPLFYLLLLLAGFLQADFNWFTDPAFTKAQWRELAAYVRSQRQPDEGVVLVSGHAWPVWQYYAPEIAAVRLPNIEILDVRAVLDVANTGQPLQDGLAGKEGAWLVLWQDEVIDPTGMAPLQLGAAGREQPVEAQFWQLKLRHFTNLQPAMLRASTPIDHEIKANFGNQLILRGYTLTSGDDLLLFWQLARGVQATLSEYQIKGETHNAANLLYANLADRRPTDYNLPTSHWQPGQLVLGRLSSAEWAGEAAIPGTYTLYLGVYDPIGDPAGLDVLAADGEKQGKRLPIALTLQRPTSSTLSEDPLTWPEIAPGLHAKFVPATTTVQLGQPLQWESYYFLAQAAPQPSVFYNLALRLLKDNIVYGTFSFFSNTNFPGGQWPVGQVMRQVAQYGFPVDVPVGEYALEVVPLDGSTAVFSLPITLTALVGNFTPPPLAVQIEASFYRPLTAQVDGTENPAAADVQLLGLRQALTGTLRVGETLPLTLVWQAIQGGKDRQEDYFVTIQLLDQNKRPVTQRDELLPGGSFNWVRDQVVEQALQLPLPQTPGIYQLIVALYYPAGNSFQRLITTGGGDYVVVTSLEIAP